MSWNSLKVGINNETVLREIIKDPEVSVRVKDAIVEQASKLAAKAVKECLEKTIEYAAKDALLDFLQGGLDNEWFKKTSKLWGDLELSAKAVEKIRSWAKTCVSNECYDAMKSVDYENAIHTALGEKLQEIGELDIKKMMQQSIDEYVRGVVKRFNIEK